MSAARQLDLLAPLAPKPKLVLRRVPDIRFPAPSSPGSESSREAADITAGKPFRRQSWKRILVALSTIPHGSALSREEIASRTEIKECSLCARLDDLRPMWVEVMPKACIAKSHKTVDGYRLTAAGWNLFRDTPVEKEAHVFEDRILEENNASR